MIVFIQVNTPLLKAETGNLDTEFLYLEQFVKNLQIQSRGSLWPLGYSEWLHETENMEQLGPSYLIRSQDLLLLFGERGRHEVDDGGDELPTGVQHVSRRDKIKRALKTNLMKLVDD